TITGLAENTAYSYRVGSDGNWSATYAFKTQSFEGDYDFLFFGDPQIGSSKDVAKDQAGWVDTMNVALNANPNAELLVSGGDQ
ncbi:fibronectin type III domain-containing protein, partial [Escherichia coli]|uniref:fibronectin type III domain-containing protein n=1 Tax=Escherichia coli TaxID=562 RepID=UPI003CF84AF5